MFEDAVAQTCVTAVQEIFILLKYVQQNLEGYLDPCQTSMMGLYAKIVKKLGLQVVFAVSPAIVTYRVLNMS